MKNKPSLPLKIMCICLFIDWRYLSEDDVDTWNGIALAVLPIAIAALIVIAIALIAKA